METATREDYLPRPGRVRTTHHLKPNRKRPHLPPSKFRSRLGFVSTRIEAPSLSLSLRNVCSFFLWEMRHAMMDNSTLYLSIHRLRSNARDHGSGPVKAALSQSGVRTREARPFFRKDITGSSCLPDHDLRADPSNHVPYGVKFRFPPKVSSPARNILSLPFFLFGSLPFVILCFVLSGRRRGNGEQQQTVFSHDGENFPPKIAKK